MGDANEGASIIEHVNEEEGEDHNQEGQLEHPGKVELEKGRREGRWHRYDAGIVGQAKREAEQRHG